MDLFFTRHFDNHFTEGKISLLDRLFFGIYYFVRVCVSVFFHLIPTFSSNGIFETFNEPNAITLNLNSKKMYESSSA